MIGVRANCVSLFTAGYTIRPWTLPILSFIGYPCQNPKMLLSFGITRLLGVVSCEDIHRQHASSLRHIKNFASDALDVDYYPDRHGSWGRHISVSPMPSNKCHVGTGTRCGLPVGRKVANLFLYICRFVLMTMLDSVMLTGRRDGYGK